MKGMDADKIADELNAAGYCTGSKRFGDRLFTKDTVTAFLPILRMLNGVTDFDETRVCLSQTSDVAESQMPNR